MAPAYADNGYQPYYYDRDAVQFTQPSTPIQTPSVPSPPAYPLASTIEPPDTPVVIEAPPSTYASPSHPSVTSTMFPVDQRRESAQYTNAPVATPAGVVVAPAVRQPGAGAPAAPSTDLLTRGGLELGLQGSNYHYQEHTASADHQFMREDGIKVGITASGTATFNYNLFLTGEARIAYSKNSYFSDPTGKINSFADDLLGEGRVLFGKDFLLDNNSTRYATYDITPYFGIGVRELYNDSSNVPGGYRRNSEYFYVPMGMTHRFRATDEGRISLNAEYDLLLLGRQSSYLNDSTSNYPNIENDQNHGFGVRGSAAYEWDSWSVGPFVNYWNINSSVPSVWASSISTCSPYCQGLEPHNQTWEYGAQLRYRFR